MSQELKISAIVDAKQAIEQLKQLTKESQELSNGLKKGDVSAKQLNSSLAVLTKGLRSYISAYAMISGGKEIYASIRDLETGFVNISKTTNMSGKGLEDFKDGLIKLGDEIHGVKFTELQDIATTAGQLGINGRDNILSFTDAISKISIATDLTAQQASEGMAIFENIMGEPITETERLGSVMNELSNTTVATASQILEFSKRIAGAGKTIGLTSTEVMAFSATLADIGTRVEGGGTAISRLFGLMASDTKAFADASKKTLEEYKNDLVNNPVKAVQDLIEQLGKLNQFDAYKVLDDLNISSEETVAVILKLATAQNKLTQNMATAKGEYEKNTSLLDEYTKKAQSMEAIQKDLAKAWEVLLVTLGESLLPVLKDLVKGMTDGVQGAREFYKENTVLVESLGQLITIGVGLLAFSRVMKAIFGAELVAQIMGATTAVEGFGIAIRAVTAFASTNPLVFASLAIFAPIYAQLKQSEHEMEVFKKKTQDFADSMKESAKTVGDFSSVMNLGAGTTTDDADAYFKRLDDAKSKIEVYTKQIEDLKKSRDDLNMDTEFGIIASPTQTTMLETYNEQINNLQSNIDKLKKISEQYKGLAWVTKYTKDLEIYKSTVDESTNSINMNQQAQERYAGAIARDIDANNREITAKQKIVDSTVAEASAKEKASAVIQRLTSDNEKLAEMLQKVAQLNAVGAKSTTELTDKQKEQLDKIKKNANERLSTEKNTLVEIYNKETDLYDDLKNLEKELAETRQKYADKRVEASAKASEKLYKASQSGLDDYQKFTQDNVRYSQVMQKATEALAKGNLEQFKTFYDEATQLADNWAGEEVKTQREVVKGINKNGEVEKNTVEEVRVTKEQAYASYQQKTQELLDLQLKSLDIEEKREVDAFNEKIRLKQVELKATQAQLKTQMEILKAIIKTVEISTGVKYDADFSDALKSIDELDNQIEALKNQKKEAKIRVDTKGATKEITDLLHYGEDSKQKLSTATRLNLDTADAEKKLTNFGKLTMNGKTIQVTADTTPADFGIKKLTSKVEGDTVTIKTTAEWNTAEAQLKAFRAKQNGEDITQDVVIEDAKTKKVLNELEKPTESTHTVNVDSQKAESEIKILQQDTQSIHAIKVDAKDVFSTISILERPTSSVHTIYVRTVEANSTGGLVGRYAVGGFVRRGGQIAGHDTTGSDDVKALLTRGEFVQNVRAVDYYGRDFMSKLNQMRIPRNQLPAYANGGLVGSLPQRFSTGGLVGGGKTVNVNLNVGNQSFAMMSDESVAIALANYMKRGEF